MRNSGAFSAQSEVGFMTLRNSGLISAQSGVGSVTLRNSGLFSAQSGVGFVSLRNSGAFSAQYSTLMAWSRRSESFGRVSAVALNRWLVQIPMVVTLYKLFEPLGNSAFTASLSSLRILQICLLEELYS